MYIKYFKNKPLNRASWLLATRVKVAFNDGYLFLGEKKIIPSDIKSVEKKSWFTRNYYLVFFENNGDNYTLSLSNKLYLKLENSFQVNKTKTVNNTPQNIFWGILIVGIIYSWYYLLQFFTNN